MPAPRPPLSPREVLKTQIARADAMGYAVKTALEFEFIVIDETGESLRAKGWEGFDTYAVDNRCWSAQSAAIYADLVAELETVLERAGVGLFGLGLELGAGCFEGTLARHRCASPPPTKPSCSRRSPKPSPGATA